MPTASSALPETRRRPIRTAVVLLLASAAVLWFASRLAWLTVSVSDDRTGDTERTITGADWSSGPTAAALVLLAATAVLFLLRGLGTRILGAVLIPVGTLAAAPSLTVLTASSGSLATRAHSLLTEEVAVSDLGRSDQSTDTIASWAQVTGVTTSLSGPSLCILASLVVAATGVLLALRPGPARARTADHYQTAAARRAERRQRLRTEELDAKDLWDELDEGSDPTDTVPGRGRVSPTVGE